MNNTSGAMFVVRKSDSVITSFIDDEAALLDASKGVYYSLNPCGRAIWEYIEESRKIDEIITYIKSVYDVDEKACTESVVALLAALLEYDLIQVGDANGNSCRLGA